MHNISALKQKNVVLTDDVDMLIHTKICHKFYLTQLSYMNKLNVYVISS